MTVCSDVMEHSAELDIINLQSEGSKGSQEDEEDEYLTF